ncbi:MAG: hypothetical protein FWE28_05280 [Oscillospiraceae bacterium]|nr:hypothetical protein [Oscillospiraceae bacterium]
MKAIRRAIDRFCYKRPRFGVPNLIRFVVFGTALVYILGLMDTTGNLYSYLSFAPDYILRGQVWRLFTFLFVPFQTHPIFLVIVLYLSFTLGSYLEQTWGTAKFTIFYLLSVIVLIVTGMVLHLVTPTFLGTFSLVNGYYIHILMLLVFTTLFPNLSFRFMFIIPMQAKWIGLIALGFLLFQLFQLRWMFPLNLTPLILALVYFIFCGETLWKHLGFHNKRGTRSAINFKLAAKRVERERQSRDYTRKCAVCGKTDTAYPDMEFRYCSRCNGYHCFCMDHINNHVHFE